MHKHSSSPGVLLSLSCPCFLVKIKLISQKLIQIYPVKRWYNQICQKLLQRTNCEGEKRMLEIIAMVTMAIDHIGAVFFPDIIAFRIIGRIAFPIYCYMIAQGYQRTGNLSKYAQRLLAMALLSQPVYMILFQISRPNVIFTLLISLGVLYILDSKFHNTVKALAIITACAALNLGFEYGVYGLSLILMYRYYQDAKPLLLLHSIINLVFILSVSPLQIMSILGTLLILRFKDVETLKLDRTLYRVFYPLHLSILLLLKSPWTLLCTFLTLIDYA